MTKALTFWLLAVVLLTSCDVFLTRDPDPPSESSSSYIPPVIDSLVFVNLANALREKNTLNYMRTFSDSSSSGRNFRFEPTTQALSRYGGVFSSWTKQSEQQYFENMKSKLQMGSAPILEFLTLTPQSRQSDSSQYNATYRLTTQHSQANVAKQVRGESQFFLMTDRSKNWVIWRWADIAQSSADSTWSDLKGGFGQ